MNHKRKLSLTAISIILILLGINVVFSQDTPIKELFSDNGITGEVKNKLINHIKQNVPPRRIMFTIANEEDEKNLIVSENDSEPFSEKVKFYSLHHRSFLHWSEIYVDFNGKFYTSLQENAFENFLKDYDFLKQQNSLKLFLIAYNFFNIKHSAIHPDFLVDEKFYRERQESLKRYETGYQPIAYKKIHPPIEKKSKNTEIIFFVENPTLNKISRVKVTISKNYEFNWQSKVFQQKAS